MLSPIDAAIETVMYKVATEIASLPLKPLKSVLSGTATYIEGVADGLKKMGESSVHIWGRNPGNSKSMISITSRKFFLLSTIFH